MTQRNYGRIGLLFRKRNLESFQSICFILLFYIILTLELSMHYYVSRPLGFERVYLPLCEVVDTPFHIQENDILKKISITSLTSVKYQAWVLNVRIAKYKPAPSSRTFHLPYLLVYDCSKHREHLVPSDMKGCICHFVKWQIHPFIFKGTICRGSLFLPHKTSGCTTTAFHLAYLESVDLFQGRRSVVWEHLQSHPLLGHRLHCLLVHLGVVNAHTAEYRKSLRTIQKIVNLGNSANTMLRLIFD